MGEPENVLRRIRRGDSSVYWVADDPVHDVYRVVEAARKSKQLTNLYIERDSLGDVSALGEWLGENPPLRVLELIQTRIVDTTPIAKAFRTNTNLRVLYLGRNPLDDLRELTAALCINTTLERLAIDNGTRINDLDLLIALLEQNTTIKWLQWRMPDPDAWKFPEMDRFIKDGLRIERMVVANDRIAERTWQFDARLALARALEKVDGDGYAKRLIITI